MAEQLGSAELELGANLAPLDAKLVEAEARVARSVAVMQAMLDKLQADVDIRVSALDALATRAATAAVPAGQTGGGPSGHFNQIWGIRGPERPGSIENPIVQIIAAGKYYPMGSRAAAVGDDNQQDTQLGEGGSGLATSADIAELTSAMQDLARDQNPVSKLAKAGAVGISEPESSTRVASVLDSDDKSTLARMASALDALALDSRRSAGSSQTIFVDKETGERQAPASRIFVAGSGGEAGRTVVTAAPGSSTVRLDGAQYAGLISAILDSGSGNGAAGLLGAGGGGGNRRSDIFYHSSGGGGGGGGGGGHYTPWFVPTLNTGGGTTGSVLGAFGLGKGIAGLAGVGTLASFAGLGAEHALLVALGILGSAGAAVGGAGALGLGAAGTIGVGAGSDLGVLKSTISDTTTLATDLTSLSQAVSVYGKNSSQAKTATAQLNADMQALGDTAGVKAELGLAKAAQAADHFFDMSTGQARVQAVNILMQAVQSAYTFIPLIAEAATRNLSIINESIKPLFAWLEGPEGVQIWNDLENKFASDLPAAMGAFDNGVELLLRIVDIASNYVGGFVGWLDKLFTRLNSESNMTLSAEIGKLVDDFRLWENFAKLLVEDLYLLFHADVGTGSSIIGMLNHMLEDVHKYEESTSGQAQLTNIFMVHKQEIDELLKVLPTLADTFSHVYMAFAPPVVAAMNDVVLPVLDGIGKALAFISKQSQAAAIAIGLLLVSTKAFGATTTFGFLGKMLGLGATGAAAGAGGAAVATGGKAAAGFTAAEGLEALGVGGTSAAFLGAGSMTAGIAAAAATALPFVLAAGGGLLVTKLIGDAVGVHVGQSSNATPTGVTRSSGGVGNAINSVLGDIGPAAGVTKGIFDTLFGSKETLNIQETGKFANYTATQLAALIDEIKKANNVKLDGTNEPKQQVLDLAEAALHLKDTWNQSFNLAWKAVNTFYRNTGMSLSDLKDDFQSNTLLIAHEVGLNSAQGEKLMATNVQKMVQALQLGMAAGTVSVKDGMAEIKSVLGDGMKDNAITWKTNWSDMFNTMTGLMEQGKIGTKTWTGDILSMMGNAFTNIKQNTIQSYQSMFASLKSQMQDGIITHKDYVTQVQELTQKMVSSEKTSMTSWAANTFDAMVATGKVSLSGAQAIAKELNELLKPLGAKMIPVPSLSPVSGLSAPGVGLHAGTNAAQGALYQIGQYGEAGQDSVPMNVAGQPIMVAPGEQVAVFNRHQLPIVNAALARMGGLPGLFANVRTPNYMAGGGMVGGSSLDRMISEADAINSHHYPYLWGGGHNSAFSGPYDCSGAVSAVLHAGGDLSAPMVADQFMNWGLPGPGAVTVYADPVHTFMSIDGRFFGTHGVDGASWYSGSAVPGFVQRHPAGIGAGGIGSINVPKVGGSGALADIVRSGLMDVGKAANRKLMSAADASMGGGQFGGGDWGTFAGGTGPSGGYSVSALEKFWTGPGGGPSDVARMAAAIAMAESGGRNVEQQGQPLATTGWGLWQITPGNSAMLNPNVNARDAVAKYDAAGGFSPWTTYEDGAYRQFMASGGMAWGDGGMVPSYASGGLPNFVGYTGPGQNLGGVAATPGYTTDINEINALLTGLGPGDVPYLSGEFNYLQGITSTDGPSPAQLSQMIGWEGQILNDYQMALHLSQVSVAPIKNAIATKKQKIATLKKRVEDNLKRIKQLQGMVKNGKKYVSGHYTGTDTRHYVSGYYVGSGNNKKYIRGHYEGKDTRKYIPGHYVTAAATKTWNAEIAKLNAEDKVLAGSFQYAGDVSLSTGGEIGKLNSSLTGLNTDLTTVQSYLPGGSAALEGAFAMDPGFPIGQAEQTLAGLQASPATSTSQSDLISLLQQQLSTSQETNFVLSQQYNVLSNLPPFGGIFHSGGVVPGPPGAARMILAEGGETITPMGGGGGDTHVHISGNNKWLEKLIDVRVEQKTRKMSRDAMRGMPGKPGLLVNH